jgi:hypothetical protein
MAWALMESILKVWVPMGGVGSGGVSSDGVGPDGVGTEGVGSDGVGLDGVWFYRRVLRGSRFVGCSPLVQ